MLREIVPAVYRRAPELVQRHALTLLSIAPELARVIEVSPELARSFEFSREGNSRTWTLRLAHGIVDFLQASLDGPGRTLCFENVHAADPTDRELISVLLRRADPDELRVSVGTPSRELGAPLGSSLEAHARLIEGGSAPSEPSSLDIRSLAASYVASDCTSDDPLERRAYESMDREVRRELHAARAAELESLDERSLTLGAIPFHHERATSDVAPLLAASAYCMRMAYYDACLDLARRGADLVGERSTAYGELGRNIVFSLLLLDRLDEVVAFCEKGEHLTDQPALRSHCAYAMAILYARVYDPSKRDYEAARNWIYRAIRLAELVPESESKVVNLVFLRNTLALVEMRTGNLQEALRLLTEGLERMRREAPSKFEMESVILLQNRARLYVHLQQLDRALEDYATLFGYEPSNSESHLERGILHQRAGRYEEALIDYEQAIAWSPPYVEPYFNRAQILSALGRKEEALSDYGYALELDPRHSGALLHRGGLRYSRGESAAARADVDRLLAQSPRHAKGLCLLGLLEMAEQRWVEARAAFDKALEIDGTEVTAWVNRATLLARVGELDAALRDLDRAIELGSNETALFNRARILARLKVGAAREA